MTTEPSSMGVPEFYRTLGQLETKYIHSTQWLDRLERDIDYVRPRLADLEAAQAEAEEQFRRLIQYANRWLPYDFQVNYTLGCIEGGQKHASERIARLKQKIGG